MLICRVISRIPKNALSKLEYRRSFSILNNNGDFHSLPRSSSNNKFAPSYQTSILNNSTLASAFQSRAVSSSAFPEIERGKEEREMSIFNRISSKTEDETSSTTLYPGMSYVENQLRWGFIRKVYGILGAQILLTTAISSLPIYCAPVNEFIMAHPIGIFVCSFVSFFGLLWPLHEYQHKYPVNFVILGLFTASFSVPMGACCAITDSKVLLEALVLTSSMVASLTAYTFWASKMGKNFSFLEPYLFSALMCLVASSIMQIFFPLGPTASAVYGAISAMVFSGLIVYDTESLIKRFTYDQYIEASVALYLDVLNLFLSILEILEAMSKWAVDSTE